MTENDDILKILDYLNKLHSAYKINLNLVKPGTCDQNEYYYNHLTLCVIDSVYSTGLHYNSTKKVVNNYCSNYNLKRNRDSIDGYPSIESQETIDDLINKYNGKGIDEFKNKIYNNKKPTSSRGYSISKAEAVLRFCEVLKTHKVKYFQDVYKIMKNKDFERDIKNITGQQSGKTYNYFLMLAGDEQKIKYDRWIEKFFKKVTGKKITDKEGEQILKDVVDKLKISFPNIRPRTIDYIIWQYERNS